MIRKQFPLHTRHTVAGVNVGNFPVRIAYVLLRVLVAALRLVCGFEADNDFVLDAVINVLDGEYAFAVFPGDRFLAVVLHITFQCSGDSTVRGQDCAISIMPHIIKIFK